MKHSEMVQQLHQRQKDLAKNLHLKVIQKNFWQTERECVKKRKCSTLRVENYFREVISRDLVLQCFIETVMEIKSPQKIVLTTSSKRIIQDKKQLLVGLAALKMISGQKSQATRAKKSIAAFKLREGSIIGCKATLRKKALYSFIDKLVFLALPRARLSLVYRGIGADSCFTVGINDPFIFVELEGYYDLFQSLHGINVALVTSIKQKGMLQLLLSGLQIKI